MVSQLTLPEETSCHEGPGKRSPQVETSPHDFMLVQVPKKTVLHEFGWIFGKILRSHMIFLIFLLFWNCSKKILENRFQYFLIFWKPMLLKRSFFHFSWSSDKIGVPYGTHTYDGFSKNPGLPVCTTLPCIRLVCLNTQICVGILGKTFFLQLPSSQKYIYTWSILKILDVLKSYESETFISGVLDPAEQDYDTPWYLSSGGFWKIFQNSIISHLHHPTRGVQHQTFFLDFETLEKTLE